MSSTFNLTGNLSDAFGEDLVAPGSGTPQAWVTVRINGHDGALRDTAGNLVHLLPSAILVEDPWTFTKPLPHTDMVGIQPTDYQYLVTVRGYTRAGWVEAEFGPFSAPIGTVTKDLADIPTEADLPPNFTTGLSEAEVAAAIAAHVDDPTGAHPATAISNAPAGNIASTTVQAALNELDTEKLGTGLAVLQSLIDAKGDLIVGTAADTAARLPVGANGLVLSGDSSQATGLTWADHRIAPELRPVTSPAAYGAELVSTDFSAGWTPGTNWTLGAGSATATAGAGTLTATVAVVTGVLYALEWTDNTAVGDLTISLGAVSGQPLASQTSAIGLVAATTGNVTLTIQPSATWAGALSAFHVRAVTASTPSAVLATSAGTAVQEIRTPGTSNLAMGLNAQRALTTGTNDVAIGGNAQRDLTVGANNVAVGSSAQLVLSSGSSNVAIGTVAQQNLTTGVGNVAVGTFAHSALTSGSSNFGMGTFAQTALTTATNDVGIGNNAHRSMTTGSNNVGIGGSVSYAPLGSTSFATTTAARQTSVGHESGQNTATQLDDITTLGYRATAGAAKGTALGSGARADHAASVALGSDTTTTAVDQVMIGTRHVAMTEVAEPAVAATNGGRLFVKDNGAGKTQLCVRFQSGASIILATEV